MVWHLDLTSTVLICPCCSGHHWLGDSKPVLCLQNLSLSLSLHDLSRMSVTRHTIVDARDFPKHMFHDPG